VLRKGSTQKEKAKHVFLEGRKRELARFGNWPVCTESGRTGGGLGFIGKRSRRGEDRWLKQALAFSVLTGSDK